MALKYLQDYFRQIRHLIQLVILVITLGIGLQLYLYVKQASGPNSITVQRPPGVEGFLPIGALMGWKHFLLTGNWDRVHPASMVILGYAVLLSFLLRKTFCGWFRPVGTVSEWCWKIRRSISGKNLYMPSFIDLPLRSIKYLLLGFFIWAISIMSTDQISSFMQSQYYKLVDVKMLYFFTRMTLLTAVVLTSLVILSFFFKNFWCRYLCPYGALLGLFSMISPTRIYRHKTQCIDCGNCNRTCPSSLPVSNKTTIRSPECTGCLDCICACPVKGALTFSTTGFTDRFWSYRKVGLFVLLTFIFTVYISEIIGHWQSNISNHEFRARLVTIDAPENTHPSIDF